MEHDIFSTDRPWLPEPVLTAEIDNPDASFERAESVTLAFLVLLETLSPEERAVFLLKDVLEHDHADIPQRPVRELESTGIVRWVQ